MMKTPAAGVLFRRLAEEQASGDTIEKLLKVHDQESAKKKGPDR
jgi:hypothetical protein